MLRNDCTNGIEEHPLDWVVVQSSKRVRDVKPMVPGVEMSVKKLVCVEEPMEKVLPCVDNEAVRKR